jgi:signal transduction histidine kinase
VMVDGDHAQIHQVFVNLLLNGIDAARCGGVLRVTVTDSNAPRGACQIAFRDSGNGIPEEMLSRLFDPFVTTKEQGIGLGLAVSRRIVEEHGGTIVAANHAEGGAEFTVTLPTSVADVDPPAAPERSEDKKS